MSPSRRRQAVWMLQDRLGVSERRACRVVGQHRSTQRHQSPVAADDQVLRATLRRISRRRPRWGYRRAHQLLLDEGWRVNRKRTQRLWREEGLRVPQRRQAPAARRVDRAGRAAARCPAGSRVGAGLPVRPDRRRPASSCCTWSTSSPGRRWRSSAGRRIDADHTVAVLDRLVAERGTAPAFIRCDNGPELTANALRDWCRFARAGSAYIEPGSPWQNPYVESFGGRIRDELLAVELFSCLTEAKVLIEDWRHDYNHHRPHSALGMLAPAVFARGYRETHPTAAPADAELRSRYAVAPFDVGGSPTLQSPTTTTHQLSPQVDR